MAKLLRAATLRHQPNLGADVEDVAFEAGDELTVLKQWGESCLCKSPDGKLFNVPKEWLEQA